MSDKPTVLCISSYFKGNRFLERLHQRGANVHLLTLDTLLDDPWSRHALTDVYGQPPKAPLDTTLRIVAFLMRTIRFDHVVALDDFDVETAAAVREMVRMPGMNVSTARLFRDKLAMRVRATELGVPVPAFSALFADERIVEFTARVPPPWMHKPRGSASAVGIHKVGSSAELWDLVEREGDGRADHLLEQYLPGDVWHVDTLMAGGRIGIAEVHRCDTPPFDVAHGGGVYAVTTALRESAETTQLLAMNRTLLEGFGMTEGASHVEFIRARDGSGFYFLECGARVGGAHTTEMIEAAIGINPWELWADLTLDGPGWEPPALQRGYGGLLMTLSHEAQPDLSSFDAPEVIYRAPEDHHAGLVISAPTHARVRTLVDEYSARLRTEITAVLPAPEEVSR